MAGNNNRRPPRNRNNSRQRPNSNNRIRNNISNRRLSGRNGYASSFEAEDLDDDIDADDSENMNQPSSSEKKQQNKGQKQKKKSLFNKSSSSESSELEEESESSDSGKRKFKIHIPLKVKIIIVVIALLIVIIAFFIYVLCAIVAASLGGSLESSSLGGIEGTNTNNPNVSLDEVVLNPCPKVTLINCRKGIDLTKGEELPEGAEFCKVHNSSDDTSKRYFIPDNDEFVHKDVDFEKYVAGVATAEVGGFGNIVVSQQLAVAARTDGITYVLNSNAYGLDACTIEYSNLTQVYTAPNDLGWTAANSTKGRVLKTNDGELLAGLMYYDAFACGKVNGSKIITLHGEQFYIINQPILKHQLIPKSFVDANVHNGRWLTCEKDQHHGDGASQYGAYYLAKEKHYNFEEILDYYYSDYIEKNVKSNSFGCYSLFRDKDSCNGERVSPDLDQLYYEYAENNADANYNAKFGWPSFVTDVPKTSFSNRIWYESLGDENNELSIYIYDCDKEKAKDYKNTVASSGWNMVVSDDDETSYYDEIDNIEGEEVISYSAENSNGDSIDINYSNFSEVLQIKILRTGEE